MAAKTMSDSWRESVGHIWIMVPRTAKEVKQKGLDLEIDERVNSFNSGFLNRHKSLLNTFESEQSLNFECILIKKNRSKTIDINYIL